MKCPVDDETLVMSERSGVEIDYCPTCRGVWLDRGELDKILDRAAQDLAPQRAKPASPAPAQDPGPIPAPPRQEAPPAPSRYGDPFDDAAVPPPPAQPGYPPQQAYPPRRGFFFGSGPSAPSPEDYYRGGYGRPRRRRSFLDDLFD